MQPGSLVIVEAQANDGGHPGLLVEITAKRVLIHEVIRIEAQRFVTLLSRTRREADLMRQAIVEGRQPGRAVGCGVAGGEVLRHLIANDVGVDREEGFRQEKSVDIVCFR